MHQKKKNYVNAFGYGSNLNGKHVMSVWCEFYIMWPHYIVCSAPQWWTPKEWKKTMKAQTHAHVRVQLHFISNVKWKHHQTNQKNSYIIFFVSQLKAQQIMIVPTYTHARTHAKTEQEREAFFSLCSIKIQIKFAFVVLLLAFVDTESTFEYIS